MLSSSAVHGVVATETSQHVGTSSDSQPDIYYSEGDSEVVLPPFLRPLGRPPLITEHVSPRAAAAAAAADRKKKAEAAAAARAVAGQGYLQHTSVPPPATGAGPIPVPKFVGSAENAASVPKASEHSEEHNPLGAPNSALTKSKLQGKRRVNRRKNRQNSKAGTCARGCQRCRCCSRAFKDSPGGSKCARRGADVSTIHGRNSLRRVDA